MNGPSEGCPSTVPPNAESSRLAVLVNLGCRSALAAVFLMAGATKVTDLRGFEDRLVLHAEVPVAVGVAVARFLPWLELTCGLCMALGWAIREAALLTGLLLLLFLGHALLTPSAADCGCFLFPGVEGGAAWWALARDSLLLLCSVRLVVCPR